MPGGYASANGVIISPLIEDTGAPDFAASDTDAEPASVRDPGDGLSAYEEYRGFIVRNEHRRTNPHFKDVFID